MFDIPISKMDDKQLRGAVQLLYDELALFKRKYEDAIYNLDEDNFSKGLVLTQDSTKAWIKLTAAKLETRMLNVENEMSELTLTASEFNLRLSDAEDGVSEISATVAGLTFSVSNGETSSKLKLMSNGVELASATIRITGMVTFDDLEGEGSTVINGANISTGFIKTIGIDSCDIVSGTIVGTELIGTIIKGSSVYLYYDHDEYGTSSIFFKWGSLKIAETYMEWDPTAETGMSEVAFFIETHNEAALKLIGDAGISIEAATLVWIEAPGYISLESEVVNIHNAVLHTADGNAWEFKDDGIYFASEKVFSL